MKALVVDDNQQNHYLLQQQLQTRGFEVITARNGAEALRLLHGAPSDLVIQIF